MFFHLSMKVLLSTNQIPLKEKKVLNKRVSGDQLRASFNLLLFRTVYGLLLRHSPTCLDRPGEMYTCLCTQGS